MTFLPQFVSAGDPAVTQKLLFLGFFFILDRHAGQMLPSSSPPTGCPAGCRTTEERLRAIDYTFAGVFSVFAVRSCSRRRAESPWAQPISSASSSSVWPRMLAEHRDEILDLQCPCGCRR